MLASIEFFILGQVAMTAISIVGCYLEKHSSEKAKAEARERNRLVEARYHKQTLLLNAYRRVMFSHNETERCEAMTAVAELEYAILNQKDWEKN